MSGSDAFDPSELTALVLDSNEAQRRISLDLLRNMGFGRTVGVGTPYEAWVQLRESNPDIVLIDWLEDGGDPLDFVRRVRSSEDSPNRAVSIFMLTSRGRHTEVEGARAAGVDGYLRKPISPAALQGRVKKVMAKPQPFVTTAAYVGPCRRRRQIEAYQGPWRRIDDRPSAISGEEEEVDLKLELCRARVAALAGETRALSPGDAQVARRVFRAAKDALEIAEQIGDSVLCFGIKEMVRYLQAQGATDHLDPEALRTHVAALHQLAHLPPALTQERDNVAQALKRMVDKKLARLSAA